MGDSKKTATPKADSPSRQRRKEQIALRNDKVLTEDKKKRLKDANQAK